MGNGETMETVSDFIILGSKITADGDCSHKIKRRLLLGRKVMTNLESILKSRDITLPSKVHLVKAMVFPVVMYGCVQCGRLRFNLWLWEIPWRRKWQPTLVFCLENPMDRGAWWATAHRVTKSQTRLSD